jgi:hypothetical protein
MSALLQSYPSHLGDIAHADGSVDRYIGRADGVYVQRITPNPNEAWAERPYEPWSQWPKSPAAQQLAHPIRLPARVIVFEREGDR